MITVRNLRHTYRHDGVYAVNDVSFEVNEGQVLGFLGPNGAGKSTAQAILTGILPLQEGDVRVGGVDVRHTNPAFYNKLGVSFEQPNVYHKLTGLENLAFYARLFSVPTEDPLELLRLVDLADAANVRAGQYSKGMQQRLVFARSMLNKPRIWFLDEPTSGLDPVSSNQIKEIIRRKQQEGVTIFLTTHNMQVADELCDQVAFINEGCISALDTPRNLKLQHGQRLVAVEWREDGQLRRESLSLAKPEDIARMDALMRSGAVETVHSQEASLEQVFMRVTGRVLA
ncbi:MAG: ABC transporter ATP-binding protein [Anaerolineae bacterium]